MADSFSFELLLPERLVFSEEVLEVTLPASEGEMTVLKDHAPAIAALRPGIMEISRAADSKQKVFLNGGFAHIKSDGLCILAEMAIPAEELTAELMAGYLKAAEKTCAEAEESAKDSADLRLAQLKEVKQALSL